MSLGFVLVKFSVLEKSKAVEFSGVFYLKYGTWIAYDQAAAYWSLHQPLEFLLFAEQNPQWGITKVIVNRDNF